MRRQLKRLRNWVQRRAPWTAQHVCQATYLPVEPSIGQRCGVLPVLRVNVGASENKLLNYLFAGWSEPRMYTVFDRIFDYFHVNDNQGWVIRLKRIISRIVFIMYITVLYKLLRMIRFWAQRILQPQAPQSPPAALPGPLEPPRGTSKPFKAPQRNSQPLKT
jgi:hypothetical protein